MKHSARGVHLWWSLKVHLQDLHPRTENTIYGPETLHVQAFILFTTFPNIVHHTERSKAANQIFWHSFSKGKLAKLAIVVMCRVCKSALTSQLTSLEWELTISYDAITALRHSEGISWKRRSNSPELEQIHDIYHSDIVGMLIKADILCHILETPIKLQGFQPIAKVWRTSFPQKVVRACLNQWCYFGHGGKYIWFKSVGCTLRHTRPWVCFGHSMQRNSQTPIFHPYSCVDNAVSVARSYEQC